MDSLVRETGVVASHSKLFKKEGRRSASRASQVARPLHSGVLLRVTLRRYSAAGFARLRAVWCLAILGCSNGRRRVQEVRQTSKLSGLEGRFTPALSLTIHSVAGSFKLCLQKQGLSSLPESHQLLRGWDCGTEICPALVGSNVRRRERMLLSHLLRARPSCREDPLGMTRVVREWRGSEDVKRRTTKLTQFRKRRSNI